METILNVGNLPLPTNARVEAVDKKVGRGAGAPEKADQKRGQLLYLEFVAGKERGFTLPPELFYSSKSTGGLFDIVTPHTISHLLKVQLQLMALKKQ